MRFTQEKALFHLTGKTDIAELSMDSIENLVKEYPFFSPVQFMFSAKLKKEDHPLASSQATKTSLFFSNPHWLQFQLEDISEKAIDEAPKQEVDTAMLRSIHLKNKEMDEMMRLPDLEETLKESASSMEMPELPTAMSNIPTIENVRDIMRGIDSFDTPSSIVPVVRNAPDSPEDIAGFTDAQSQAFDNDSSDNASLTPKLAESEKIQPEPIQPARASFTRSLANLNKGIEQENYKTLPDQDQSNAKIASILSSQLAAFKEPIKPEEQLEFASHKDKLHTVDYFASQGIQIDLTKIPQDKLTTKLRKFTDWLRDLKNNGVSATELRISPESEKAVAATALVSNESKEILTETMAEVLVKQGQIDKAIQLYIKLSFSNPEKTTYFASKIQQLKGI